MDNFVFYNPAKIIFGKDQEKTAGEWIRKYDGHKVLLHYGGGSIKKNGVYDTIIASLKANDLPFVELGGVVPNPRYSLIQEGIALCKREDVDFILAVGGGSVIDSAKGIAAGVLLNEDEDLWEDYYMFKRGPEKALPLGTVLTIPATGSESSRSSVVTNEATHFKRSMAADCMIPKFSIINPKTHYSLPPYQIACGCADILAHLMERYFTPTENVDFTDRMLEASMKTVINYAPLAIKYPTDYNIRAEIAWVGTIAHNGLLNTGRLGDWASHDLEHELGAIYDIYHGEGLAITFPAWMKYVYKQNPKRFVQFAQRVWDVEFSAEQEERIIFEGIHRLERFFTELGLPIRCSQLHIDHSRFREMAQKIMVNRDHEGVFMKLYEEDCYQIYCLSE
ncbi:iron-containing alcohol dehydrogenase [Dielma fastidiosa]|uniref:iron-containing alcohol dehydrogenase n=1 Tax=Dielma fastidiosa TaxID=1034346 RepID=UPI000D79BE6C|nr:iron-containing alcohol dehydrogenase [Dielma fastidiosa]MBS6168487.1 iron-containing alcohol dehydrogenase [Bacillota bacterium]PWM64709.1 MAG: NADH-dependent alcohol dehydrogenase [Dielma fastidiosa]